LGFVGGGDRRLNGADDPAKKLADGRVFRLGGLLRRSGFFYPGQRAKPLVKLLRGLFFGGVPPQPQPGNGDARQNQGQEWQDHECCFACHRVFSFNALTRQPLAG
jgi:hypothetical protein